MPHADRLVTNFLRDRYPVFRDTIHQLGLGGYLQINDNATNIYGARLSGHHALERRHSRVRDLSIFWRTLELNEQKQKEKHTMKLSDLKTGMRLVRNNGTTVIVMLDTSRGNCYTNGEDAHGVLETMYYADLSPRPTFENYKILHIYDGPDGVYKMFNPSKKGCLLWTAPPKVKEMTVAEIEKALGYSVKVVK